MTKILNGSIVISMNTQLSRSHTCEQVWYKMQFTFITQLQNVSTAQRYDDITFVKVSLFSTI